MRQLCGVMETPLALLSTNLAATSALYLPTSDFRKRNCRLRLEMSMVSRGEGRGELDCCILTGVFPDHRYAPISMTWISLKRDMARFLRISHPKPPAPLCR